MLVCDGGKNFRTRRLLWIPSGSDAYHCWGGIDECFASVFDRGDCWCFSATIMCPEEEAGEDAEDDSDTPTVFRHRLYRSCTGGTAPSLKEAKRKALRALVVLGGTPTWVKYRGPEATGEPGRDREGPTHCSGGTDGRGDDPSQGFGAMPNGQTEV